eukprot:11400-Pleurochrysis_carterae.AAC.1
MSEAETHLAWRRLMLSFFCVDTTDADTGNGQRSLIERFMVENIGPVCATFCRRAYGIGSYRWNTLHSAARSGELRVHEDGEISGMNSTMHRAALATSSRDDQ